MAWSPVRRTNAGRFEVNHPGDYATLNSYHPSDATGGVVTIPQSSSPSAPLGAGFFLGGPPPREIRTAGWPRRLPRMLFFVSGHGSPLLGNVYHLLLDKWI